MQEEIFFLGGKRTGLTDGYAEDEVETMDGR